MSIFIKYITKLVLGYLKRIWYYIKLERLFSELKVEKQEAKDAIKNANADNDEFSRIYAAYLDSKTHMRPGTREVRKDSDESEESN